MPSRQLHGGTISSLFARTNFCYYLVYVGWLIVELVTVYLFFVETKGPTLEEMAKIFDGDEAKVGHVDLEIVREKNTIVHEEKV